jgi:LacI family transcriptional regulator
VRPVTMADLAALAGVSSAAVSLALRGSEKISEDTRSRIAHLAHKHGYVYNRQAADLRTQTSRTAAVCLHTISNPVFSGILAAVERVFWARGWSVMFGESGDEIAKQSAFIARSIESNVAGLIISPAVGTRSRHLEAFGQRLPIVVAGREIRGGAFDRVCIEYEKGLTSAVAHLVSLGHQAIGWMGGGSNTATARRGIRTYRRVLLKHGLRPSNLWEYICPPSRHDGYVGMRQFLKVAPELTAVVCFSDLLAIGAMRALHQQGMIPGRDMSVIGFDDLEEAEYAFPPLSTVHIDLGRLGERAAEFLLARVENRLTPRQEASIAVELVLRQTTAPPPSAHTGSARRLQSAKRTQSRIKDGDYDHDSDGPGVGSPQTRLPFLR